MIRHGEDLVKRGDGDGDGGGVNGAVKSGCGARNGVGS